MKPVDQETYTAPADADSLSEEPLVIHRRPRKTNDQLVIFVHGLGGRRYGKKTTWGRFPEFTFSDFESVDVGMYQFRTATHRWFSSRSVSVESEAEVFAGLIRNALNSYRTILLVGHSLGGLLCKATIRQLLLDRDQNSLARIGGLILMGTPQLGSLRTPRWLGPLSFDARALAANGKLVEEINDAFENEIALDEEIHTIRKTTIPTWAVQGVYDHWVDPLSAGIGLPYSRRFVVRGSHTSIVKPADRNSDVYKWVAHKIEKSLNRFTYDVFIAAVMAGHATDEKYAADRAAVEELKQVLIEKCGFTSVFYAGTKIASMVDFDPKALALRDDLDAMRRSRNFLLYFPERVASSVLYEAGWALILGKPSVYLVRDDKDLPFLLNDARQAFNDGRVKILEAADTPAMLKLVASWGSQLFEYK